jgi:GTP 3',8-cyclase
LRIQDGQGRIHDDLRVSVTDRCNLRCAYCMPEEPLWFPREAILRYEEIVRIVRTFIRMGVRKVRITGGEPLVRRDLPRLVEMVAGIAGIEDLSLTTNGVLLAPVAGDLKRAGLTRINVSLDTLVPERFKALTGRDHLGRVMEGLEAAREAGFHPIKINTVLLRGVNDDEAEALVEAGRDRGWEVRFIEFMPLENGGTWDLSRVVTGAEVRLRIGANWPFVPDPAGDPHAPAERYVFADGRGAVGFIDSVTEPFCAGCSRIRLTAEGRLRVCLYDDSETDLKGPLRAGAGDGVIEGLVREAVARKGRGGALEILERRAAIPLARTMHQIGG